jgi:probable HAF family extracellular repeat protein
MHYARSLARQLALVCLALAVCRVAASAQTGYGIVDLGTLPGGAASQGLGVNNTGQAVGYSSIPTGQHAFVSAGGSLSDLLAAFHAAQGGSSQAFGLNDAGQATGLVRLSANSFAPRGFFFDAGAVTVFGTLGGTFSQGNAVNGAGQVVGVSSTANNGGNRAFLWSGGVMTDLGVLGLSTFNNSEARSVNDLGQVVGVSSTAAGANHAFLWQNGSMVDLGVIPGGGGTISSAADVNNLGHVVGFSNVMGALSQVQHAFLWTSDGGMVDLGTLGGSTSQARSINDSGVVVGMSITAANQARPFIYRNGVMTDLTTLLPAGHCYATIDVNAIGNDGAIVATAQVSGQQHRAVLLVPGSASTGTTNCGGPPPPPPTPADVIAQMRAAVSDVEQSGVANSLDVKLRNLLNALGDNGKATTCSHLAAFVNEVDAQAGKHLNAATAADLRLKAAQLAGLLGCQ